MLQGSSLFLSLGFLSLDFLHSISISSFSALPERHLRHATLPEKVAGATNRAPIRTWSVLQILLVDPGNGAICFAAFLLSSSPENCQRFVSEFCVLGN